MKHAATFLRLLALSLYLFAATSSLSVRTLEATELCNGLDDDSNGVIDDGFAIGEFCVVGNCGGEYVQPWATSAGAPSVVFTGDAVLIGTALACNFEHNYPGVGVLKDFFSESILQLTGPSPHLMFAYGAMDIKDWQAMENTLNDMTMAGTFGGYELHDVSAHAPLHFEPGDLNGVDVVVLDAAPDPDAGQFALTAGAKQVLRDFQANGGAIVASAYIFVHWYDYHNWQYHLINTDVADLFDGVLPDMGVFPVPTATTNAWAPIPASTSLATYTSAYPGKVTANNPFFHDFWTLSMPGGCYGYGVLECTADGSDVQCDAASDKPEICGNGLDDNCNCEVDEGFNVPGLCAVDPCTGESGPLVEWRACLDIGHYACAADGGQVCEVVGDGLTELWSIGDFDLDVNPIIGSSEFPANDQHYASFDYDVGDMDDQLPAYLSDTPLRDIDPSRPLTDSTPELRVHFELGAELIGGILQFSRYGSEENLILLEVDGALLATTAGAEGQHAMHEFALPPLSAGAHALVFVYAGGGSANGNYIDAMRMIGPADAGSLAVELCGNGIDDDCDCETDEGFDDLGESCELGLGVCFATGELVCAADGLDLECSAVPGAPTGDDADCDGLDDDCDGLADNHYVPVATSCGVGECAATGELLCVSGGLLDSCDMGAPGDEICDGLDNDCDGAFDEGFDLGASCYVNPCGYELGVPAVLQPCMEPGLLVCADDGGTECQGAGYRLATLWQLGGFDFDIGRARDGAVEYPADGVHSDTFEYVIRGDGDPAPDMPGYLSDVPMSAIDPSRAQTNSTPELHLVFELAMDTADARLHWSRYGSEVNQVLLAVDDTLVFESYGAEGTNAVHDIALPFLSAGSHELVLLYAGGGAENGNYIDALRLVAPNYSAPGDELCGNGLDDNCNCEIDEGFELLGAACWDGDTDCLVESSWICTDDLLSMDCVSSFDETLCVDGNECTNESCEDGSCVTTMVECDDADACTDDYCHVTTGCVFDPITCDDGDACTDDSCDPVSGCSASAITCDDGDACTTDGCDWATGCTTAPIACDDNDACTSDSCDPATGCVFGAITCDDNDACTDDSCDPATGCVFDPVTCDDRDACTADSCDPATGCVFSAITCDDHSACTDDSCKPAIGCVFDPVGCDDGVACTADSCDPATGCVFDPDDADCADGNPCTFDVCDMSAGCVNTAVVDGQYSDPGYDPQQTQCGAGACHASGQMVCAGGQLVDGCVAGSPTGADTDCDAIDDDCDGLADNHYVPSALSCGVGECAATGELVCDAGSLTEVCEPGLPGDEICDGLDNDCDGLADEGFGLGESCYVNPCGYELGVPAVFQPCMEPGLLVCAADGGTECQSAGYRLATVWQLGGFDFDGGQETGGAAEYPANGEHSDVFEYVITGDGDPTPDMPGYLSDVPMSQIDPNRAQINSTPELRLVFDLAMDTADARLHWSRYGSEVNQILLAIDDTLVFESSGAEGANAAHDIALPFLAAGSHTLVLLYAGGGAANGNYIDALRLVAPDYTSPANELCGNGLDDNCNCEIDEGFELLGASCWDGDTDCLVESAWVCADDLLGMDCESSFDETLCGDGNECTNDFCEEGACVTTVVACDDANACTSDSCDPATGCVFDTLTCNDADACTADSCDSGTGCVFDTITCDDADACTADSCDSASGCVFDTITCDDADACTADSCDSASGCVFDAITCNDADACTADSCDSATGCVFDAISCNDADACTADSCDSASGCVFDTITCDDADACTADSCDSASGCVFDTVTCDDADACTADSCDSASGCVFGGITCDDADACTADSCDPASGCIFDGVTCDDGVACTMDSCDPASGCVFERDDSPCADGNPCTFDVCDMSAGCLHTAVVDGHYADPSYVPEETQCGQGACMAGGQMVCVGGQLVDGCIVGNPTGNDRDCDGVDDDCDGSADEHYVVETTSCGVGACASNGLLECIAGSRIDNCLAGSPSAETCDSLDNDCNGQTDEVCSSIAGKVFLDENMNGVFDAGEFGMPDETVTLELVTRALTPLDADTTDAAGDYSFTGLAAGDYRVEYVEGALDILTTTNPVDATIGYPSEDLQIDFGVFRDYVTRGFVYWRIHTCSAAPGLPITMGEFTFATTEDVHEYMCTTFESRRSIFGHQLLAAKLNAAVFGVGSFAWKDIDGDGQVESVLELIAAAETVFALEITSEYHELGLALFLFNTSGLWSPMPAHVPTCHPEFCFSLCN